MFTWDFQSSKPFWSTLRMQPVLTDQVVCYKALITTHKLMVGGPHIVLGEALGERNFFENCMRVHGGVTLGFGYGPLIHAYVEFLLEKLEFHRVNPEFTGNFDYEEYLSLKGVANLDEGYQTIGDLMDLQTRVDRFQKTVFVNVRPMAQNECRIASLVPLIEESYGIYKFITSMLSAMHLCIESADPLLPLVERYNTQFYSLKKFYSECETLRYLTSLVAIPKLPEHPPSFDIGGPDSGKGKIISQVQPLPEKREKPSLEKRVESADLLGDFASDSDLANSSRSGSGLEQMSTYTHTLTTVPVVDEQTLAALSQAQQQVATLTEQIQQLLSRHQQDQLLLQQYNDHFSQAQQQINMLSISSQQNSSGQDGLISALQGELQQWQSKYEAMSQEAARWKAKYEGMAALYQALRSEHMDALSKLRSLQQMYDEERNKNLQTEEPVKEEGPCNNLVDSLGDRLAAELSRVSQAIEAAAARIENIRTDPSVAKLSSLNTAVHSAIVDGAAIITTAIGNLIRYAIQAQAEIVAAGKGSGTPEAFYKKNSEWTNGLISAAQTVAAATMTLVETADGVIKGTHQLQHLVAASNNVAAATMQLVTASRVKVSRDSKAQPLLEHAAKAVTDANRRLVDSASNAMSPTQESAAAAIPADAFGLKVEELERQARVLSLEKELSSARNELASLRKAAYAENVDHATPSAKDSKDAGDDNALLL